MGVAAKEIMEMMKETKAMLEDFMKYMQNIDVRLKKVEAQIS